MKRIICFLLLISIAVQAQSQRNTICRLGFDYEISANEHWGKDKLVITHVTPYSSAESSGLKMYDIIEEIDGVSIIDLSDPDIFQLLNPADKNEVSLSIRSLGSKERIVRVRKDCKRTNAITEDQLASAFGMYSLETTSERQFVCPFKTSTTADPVDFGIFNTYSFSRIDENNRNLETRINEHISKELTKKGLIRDDNNPDMIVETYYFFDRNPNYKGTNKIMITKEPIYRYDASYSKMELMPFLSPTSAESEAEYLLQFGIRFVDQRNVHGRILWECEANELLDNSYRMEDYARIHIPLMCMQYPFVKYTRNVSFTVNKKSYNYTGIQYDIDKLERIIEVDRNSPAYAAGIRAQDVIERIGRHKLNKSAEEYSKAYKRFITNTMNFRDTKTLFTDVNGFKYCMFWDTFKYTQIADAFRDTDNMAVFSYLYDFAPYVNPSGNNTCIFEIKRGKEKKEITIRPTIRAEITLEVK